MKGSQSVWMVIHLARSEDGAQRIADMLGGEGLVVKTHPIYRLSLIHIWMCIRDRGTPVCI